MLSINYRPGTHRFLYREQGIAYVVQSHGSVLDALHYAEKCKAWPRHICSSLRTDSAAFHGTPDWESALTIAREGWPEGRSYLRNACAAMPKASLRDRVTQWDEAGAYPDVARAAAGAPDCMVAEGICAEKPTQSIRVVVSVATPWTTELCEFVNRGAAILSAVEAAEAAGNRVEIVVEETVIGNGLGFSASILLKSAGNPADRDSLSFFLIHPSSLRRVFFALLETESGLEHFCHGYGIPFRQPAELRPPCSVYLPNFRSGDFSDVNQSLSKVKDLFAEAGCAVSFQE
jgi:hypothetical protein